MAAELTDLIIRDCCECDRPEKYDVDTVELRVSDLRLIIDRHLASLLPGVHYMDPPDGGDVSVSEQLSRMSEDAAAYRALATQQATQGAGPDGWLYVMHMEGGQKNKAFSEEQCDFPTHNPFGRRGRDYSEEYEVTEHPIHLTAPPPDALAHRESAKTAEELWIDNGRLRAQLADKDDLIARLRWQVDSLHEAGWLGLGALQSDQAQAGKGDGNGK